MQLSEIRINLCGPVSPLSNTSRDCDGSRDQNSRDNHGRGGRLRAYCSLTFDRTFVVRGREIDRRQRRPFPGHAQPQIVRSVPARCGEKNHLRARFCNQCGTHLDEIRHARDTGASGNSGGGNSSGNSSGGYSSGGRIKLHADIAHPINAACRLDLERNVVMAYFEEIERSHQPGYIPQNLDTDLDGDADQFAAAPRDQFRLRPTGTDPR